MSALGMPGDRHNGRGGGMVRVPAWLFTVTVAEFAVAAYLAVRMSFFARAAADGWMWSITPFNTRFLGAMYVTAVVVIAPLVCWPRVLVARIVEPIAGVFGVTLLLVSIAYWERFESRGWDLVLWFGLYAVMPCVAAIWLQRDGWPPPGSGKSTGVERTLLLAICASLAGYGAVLLAAPATATEFWPWPVDNFHARLYSGAFLALGGGAFAVLRGAGSAAWLLLGGSLLAFGAAPVVTTIELNRGLDRVNWERVGSIAWLAGWSAVFLSGCASSACGLSRWSHPGWRGIAGWSTRCYLAALSLGLVVQGAASLAAAWLTPGLLDSIGALTDPWHSLMHVVWGTAMLAIVVCLRRDRVTASTCLVFGLYYSGLALVVATLGSPPALHVTASQNVFHILAGPGALAFGTLGLAALRRVE